MIYLSILLVVVAIVYYIYFLTFLYKFHDSFSIQHGSASSSNPLQLEGWVGELFFYLALFFILLLVALVGLMEALDGWPMPVSSAG